MANLTLIDIAKLSGNDTAVPLIEESIKSHPETALLPSRTIKGTQYKTLIREALPTVAFRNVNEGATTVKARYGQRIVETFIMDVPVECDKAAADANEDGAAAVLALEAQTMLEASFRHVASQVWYGVTNDAKGFPGMKATVDSSMVVDATGSTGSTTTIWAVRLGGNGVSFVVGRDGAITVSDVKEVRLTDGNDNPYDGYRQNILAYIGMQVTNIKAFACIKNVEDVTGKRTSDSLLYKLLETFPAGAGPDVIFMSKLARRLWRESRTATNPTGMPAPYPETFEGVRIAVTDMLTTSETAW